MLQELIRFDTTNPPGNEAKCITFIEEMLRNIGLKTTLLAKDPKRPNLISRLKGRGNAPPLLLYGYADVVSTENQKWTHPPFAGVVADGYVWGRGALDMKGGLAMMLTAFMRAKAEDLALPGDVVLAVLSDEEAGRDFGAKHLVEKHAELFRGIRYAIGEFGGFTLYIREYRFYPIMIAEKQMCFLNITLRGPGGHGSMGMRGGAMAKLGLVLKTLDQNRLPVHVTPPAREMFLALASPLPFPKGFLMRRLVNPALTTFVLRTLGKRGQPFDPLLHNTVNTTVVQGGTKDNVIPAEVRLKLDGRLLPGLTPENLIAELRSLLVPELRRLKDFDDEDFDIELGRHDPGPAERDMSLFDTLASIVRELDPGGVPIPLLLPAVTDARHFSRLGIQTYGFLPMQLSSDISFMNTIHAGDERIPVKAVEFGASAIYKLVNAFGKGI